MTEVAATVRDVTIAAGDGLPLAATLFERGAGAGSIVVIGSATAVPRGYYRRFATWLASGGPAVLTFDYRGIGGSCPPAFDGAKARMRDWGERDCKGVLAWAEAQGYRSIRWIGHSFGGFGPVLADNSDRIERLLMIATMSGYWGHMQGFEAWKVAFGMGCAVPAAALTLGYVPGQIFGGAEHLPRGIALEFSRWCMSPGFFFDDETFPARQRLRTFAAPTRFCRPLDDPWCTIPALEALVGRFEAAETSIWTADAATAGGPIGHIGFFRDRFRDTLWPEARDWILAPAASVRSDARPELRVRA